MKRLFSHLPKQLALLIAMVSLFSFCSLLATAQRAGGTLRGTVFDPSGAVVPGATVNATNQNTGVTSSTQTTSAGTYVFPNLLIGPYSMTVQAPSFQQLLRKDINVLPNQVTTADAKLTVGATTAEVEVTAGGETVQTNTSQLSNDFSGRAVQDLPTPGIGGSTPLNLAILAPNTTTQGAGVLGEGGSIGGARPRMNSFNIDGVDDNRVDVTGHTTEVIPETVADFNLVTNMFSAEMGHSAGGQFNIVTQSGTNSWHGQAFEFNNNRDFNAMDNLEKESGLTQPRRVDRNRLGGTLGGPIIHDRLFIFGAYQYNNIGLATSSVAQKAPTAEGLKMLQGMAADDAIRNLLGQFPTAAAGTETETVNGVAIPVGTFQPSAPNFQNEHTFNVNTDLNAGAHQVRFRFLYDRSRQPWVNPDTPLAQFTGALAQDGRKVILTDDWAKSSRLVNSLRLSYSRFVQAYTVPGEFANFPNAIVDTLGLNVGPESNSPQSYVQNNYQILNTTSIVFGSHNFKFGPEYRRWIAPTDFLPRSRGEWDYATLQELVSDVIPTGFNGALRGAGSGLFDGNQHAIYGFVQDDWKVSSRLTLNLGARYEWTGNPSGVKLQALNAISTLPGAFEFRVPKTDTNNLAPRIGFAYDMFGDGKTALRGGFGISYDVIPQNFPLLELPPQLQTEQRPDITCALPGAPGWCAGFLAGGPGVGFLGQGGLLQVNVPPATQQDARDATQGIILDQVAPKILTWTLSLQHEIAPNTSMELRYLGTRSEHLLVQSQLNLRSAFSAGLQPLPTYFSAADVPAAITGGSRLSDFENFNPAIHPEFAGAVTGFPYSGSAIYHAGSVDVNRRMTHNLLLRGNYTWAHNLDNSTNELFSSRVNPRRPQDWQHPEQDWGNSTLDVRHKFSLLWVYDLPTFDTGSAFLKAVLGGWEWTGNYLVQSGPPVSILSGTDANGNGDAAGDRAILNPNGAEKLGTTASNFVCAGPGGATSIAADCGGSQFVAGYVADDPNARYIQANLGSMPTVGRNTFRSPGLNIWNMGVYKNTHLTERTSLQFRVAAFNVFNHRNFSLAQPTVLQTGNIIGTVNNALSSTYTNVAAGSLFLNEKQFSGGNRTMELGLKLIW
jgi:hypothetical protein